jgi:hypothetical protein
MANSAYESNCISVTTGIADTIITYKISELRSITISAERRNPKTLFTFRITSITNITTKILSTITKTSIISKR